MLDKLIISVDFECLTEVVDSMVTKEQRHKHRSEVKVLGLTERGVAVEEANQLNERVFPLNVPHVT